MKGCQLAGLMARTAPTIKRSTTATFTTTIILFIIFIVTTLLVIGIKESANFNNIFVVIKRSTTATFTTTIILLKLADSLIPITSSVVTMKIMMTAGRLK